MTRVCYDICETQPMATALSGKEKQGLQVLTVCLRLQHMRRYPLHSPIWAGQQASSSWGWQGV